MLSCSSQEILTLSVYDASSQLRTWDSSFWGDKEESCLSMGFLADSIKLFWNVAQYLWLIICDKPFVSFLICEVKMLLLDIYTWHFHELGGSVIPRPFGSLRGSFIYNVYKCPSICTSVCPLKLQLETSCTRLHWSDSLSIPF